MKSLLTPSDILSDIEFELLQGSLSKDELGQSIQTVKQYHYKLRQEVFESSQKLNDAWENTNRQFQFNEMVLTILQEVAASIQSLQLQVDKIGRVRGAMFPIDEVDSEIEERLNEFKFQASPTSDEEPKWRSTDDLEEATKLKTLYLEPELQPSDLPVFGGLIRRFRSLLHNLILFYISRFAEKQMTVNQTYSDWIIYLNSLQQHHQEERELLTVQIAKLHNRLSQIEQTSPPT